MKRVIPFSPLLIGLLGIALAGCGSTTISGSIGTGGGGSVQTVPISFNISDAPPANVTILRFQIQVTSASLQPSASNSSQQPVSMLTSATTVELEHLQSESALLSNLSVPAGTYTSLTAAFANPQMTILNRTSATLTVGSQSCAAGAVCTVTPTLNQTSVMDESAPFPITLSSASPVGLVLHFDVNASVQNDLSISPTINLKALPPMANGALEQFHAMGRVTAINATAGSFTLQIAAVSIAPSPALSLNVTTNANTQYEFGSVCAADTFACLAVGQVVRVALNGMPGGTLVASNVALVEPPGLPVLEGVVIGVNTAQDQVELALMDFQDDSQAHLATAQAALGLAVIVQLSSSTTFNIDTDGITLPTSAGLSFASVNDIMIGQTLAIGPAASAIQATGAGPTLQLALAASNVRLESSEVTATVESVGSSTFTIAKVPPLYATPTPPITEIIVEPVAGTNFENVSGLSGLADGDTVSVGGLLFNTPNVPTLIAERVLLR
ncbi:MAG: DUF5666 domain-containing protein [Candidatus Acidiferrales bacterium]